MTAALEQLRRQQRGLEESWAYLRALWAPAAVIRELLHSTIPSWAQPAALQLWLGLLDKMAESMIGLDAAIGYLLAADEAVTQGGAAYVPSDDRPGDLDLVLQPETAAELGPLHALLAAEQPQGDPGSLGIAPLAAGVVIAVVGIVGATASTWAICKALGEYWTSDRVRIRAGLLSTVLAAQQEGAVNDQTAGRMVKVIETWTAADARAAAAEDTGIANTLRAGSGLVKWIVIGGALVAALQLGRAVLAGKE